jgi:hypothetical protein
LVGHVAASRHGCQPSPELEYSRPAARAGCDASFLCAKQPALFYGTPDAELAFVAARYAELRDALPGMDIDDLVSQDPKLLFLESLTEGLAQLHELWDVDADALRASETFEVALAIRALSPCGPPRKF